MKDYSSTKIILNSGVSVKSELIRSMSSKAFNTQRAQHELNKSPSGLPSFPLGFVEVEDGGHRITRRSNDSVATNFIKQPLTLEKVQEDLHEELNVLKRLGKHVEAFKSHVENIALGGQIDWKKTKMTHLILLTK